MIEKRIHQAQNSIKDKRKIVPKTKKRTSKKTPKGIMRIAVSLHCFVDMVKLQRVAWQRPQQGTKSCRMGRNSVRPSVCPSTIHARGQRTSWKGLRGQLMESEGLPEGSGGQPEESESLLQKPRGQLLGPEGLPEGCGCPPKGSEGLPEGSISRQKAS